MFMLRFYCRARVGDCDGSQKHFPFAEKFVASGEQFRLSSLREGSLIIENKPGRNKNIKENIEEVFAKRVLGFKEALAIKGKVRVLGCPPIFRQVRNQSGFSTKNWETKVDSRVGACELLFLV